MKTLEELNKEAANYLMLHDLQPKEFDKSINDLSKSMIETMKNIHGSCFMYKINLRKKEDVICQEYTKQQINNFCCDFIAPVKDEQVIQLINNWNNKGTKTQSEKWEMIERIFDRVKEINGYNLIWV